MIPTQDFFKLIDLLFKWLEIREEHGVDFPGSLDQLKISMLKSSLLKRMIEGKEPLPYPPPRSYSYPWYSLIEDGEGTSKDVWRGDAWVDDLYNCPTLIIDQFPWKIIKELSPEEWFVVYSYKDFEESTSCEDTWHVFKSNDLWHIKRLNA